jgi:transposase
LAGRKHYARLARPCGHLAKAGVTRVGIEATGGYERGVVEHLRAVGFTVLVLQPIQVKAFGRVHLRRAKNDALDAVLIAACAATLDQPRIAPDPRLAELARYLTFLEQAEEDIARFKTRLEHIDEPRLRRIVASDIARLKARRAAQIRDIARRLRAHDDLAKRLELVLSIPGIGERTALALIVRMPELGRVSREEAAALAGLAPFDDDSGQHSGQRHIPGGVPLEQGPDCPLRSPYCARQGPQRSPHRLRTKAPDLRQYRRPAWNAMDRKSRLAFNGCYEVHLQCELLTRPHWR